MAVKEARELVKREAQVPEGVERISPRKIFSPRADIYEKPDCLAVYADMPGVDEKSVDVTLEQNVLTITGAVREALPKGYTLARAEYAVGDYQRVFKLSDEVDREKISAVMKNGVLCLTLPKMPQAQSRKIAVKAA